MTDYRLLASVQPWIESQLGVPLSAVEAGTTAVMASAARKSDTPLMALKAGAKAAVIVRPEWVDRIQGIVDGLDTDLLFSTFGAYELARVTLPDGAAVWGPSWYLFADEETWRPGNDDRPVKLEPPDLAEVDFDVFWHCRPDCLAGFAVYEGTKLVALATVWDHGDPIWEIGMDVLLDARGIGLGRAVVSAAARWILDNGKLAAASTAAFNVPSARTLRSVGLRYVFSAMRGTEGVMNLPPQPLGAPLPGARLHNLYPEWAMNKDILPKRPT